MELNGDAGPVIEAEPIPTEPNNATRKEDEELFGDKKRKENKAQTTHRLSVAFAWILFVLVAIGLFIRAIHLLAPPNVRWLTPEEIQQIDEYGTGGIVGAILIYLRGRILN